MVEVRLRGDARLSPLPDPFDVSISLGIYRSPEASISIDARLAMREGIVFSAGATMDKRGITQSIRDLDALVKCRGDRAYIEDMDGFYGFGLRFDAVPSRPGLVALSGLLLDPMIGAVTQEAVAVGELDSLKQGPFRLLMGFQSLFLPVPEVERLVTFLRTFLAAYGDELWPSMDSYVDGAGRLLSSSEEWMPLKHADPGRDGDAVTYPGFALADTAMGWLVVADGAGTRLLHTRNGGRDWSAQPLEAARVAFVDGQAGWAIDATRACVHRTMAGGDTWAPAAPTPAGGLADLAAISPDEVWCISEDGLYHTTDSGQTWATTPLPSDHAAGTRLDEVSFLDEKHGWVLGRRSGGPLVVFSTADGGSSFRAVAAHAVGVCASVPPHICFASAQDGWIAHGGRALLHSADGGESWMAVSPDVDGHPMEAQYHDCQFATPQLGWAVGQDSNWRALAIVTQDGGRTWRRSTTGAEDVVDSVLQRLAVTRAGHAWVVGYGGLPDPTSRSGLVAYLLAHCAQDGA